MDGAVIFSDPRSYALLILQYFKKLLLYSLVVAPVLMLIGFEWVSFTLFFSMAIYAFLVHLYCLKNYISKIVLLDVGQVRIDFRKKKIETSVVLDKDKLEISLMESNIFMGKRGYWYLNFKYDNQIFLQQYTVGKWEYDNLIELMKDLDAFGVLKVSPKWRLTYKPWFNKS